jgi:hypothetical protein
MNPYALLAALLVAIGLFGGGVTVGAKWEAGRQAIENQHIAEAVDAANNAAARAIAQIKVTNKTITNEVRRELEKETIYRDCKLTPNGVQLANQALTGTRPTGDSKLPKTDTPGK